MILFCFVLVNKLVSRVWGWLERHLKRYATPQYPTKDATIINTALPHHLPPHRLPSKRLPRRLRRPLKGSDNQPNAVLHLPQDDNDAR